MEALTAPPGGAQPLTARDIEQLFGDGYREVAVTAEGVVIDVARSDAAAEMSVRTLKTGRTWYVAE